MRRPRIAPLSRGTGVRPVIEAASPHCHAAEFRHLGKAMLRKSAPSMTAPFPAILQRTASISALPRAEKRFMMAMRIWISAVWRAGSFDMILSPKSFRQFIKASTRLRA